MNSILFSVIHTVGHCVNFYHVSTQPVEHLRCLTKELQFESDSKPTFSYWIFGTVTGLTGVSLVVLVAIIFIFAHPRIRQKAYSYFWTTHSLYFLLYILMFVHGLAKITGVMIDLFLFILFCIILFIEFNAFRNLNFGSFSSYLELSLYWIKLLAFKPNIWNWIFLRRTFYLLVRINYCLYFFVYKKLIDLFRCDKSEIFTSTKF